MIDLSPCHNHGVFCDVVALFIFVSVLFSPFFIYAFRDSSGHIRVREGSFSDVVKAWLVSDPGVSSTMNNYYKLSGAVKAGPMWLFRSDFPSCSESADIWHVHSLCVEKCPGFFFKNAEKYGQNCVKFNPPSLSVSKQRRISILESQNTVRVSFTLLEGGLGGGGGGLSRTCLKPCFPACGKKRKGNFFTEKESACQISADSEQLEKLLRSSHIGLACMEPFNYYSYNLHCSGIANTSRQSFT